MNGRSATGVAVVDAGPEWILVPELGSFDTPDALREWAESTARARTADEPDAFGWLSLSLAAVASSSTAETLHALYLPSVRDELALVRVIAAASDQDGVDLAQAVGIGDRGAVETPVVEPFTTASLGTGVRAVRFHVTEDDREITGIVTYAFAVSGVVVRVSYADTDLARLTNLAAAVDEFVGSIKMQYGEPPTDTAL